MSEFRVGDRIAEITGQPYHLRLSVSALAEMAFRLEAESPKALAARLRSATLADWNIVLDCVTRPVLTRDLGREEMLSVLPILSAVITDGLRA